MKEDASKKEIIAAKDFYLHNKLYKANKKVDITDKSTIIKLNEQGFIKPLSMKEIKELSH